VPHLEKCAALGKICHTLKNVPHFEKCATLGKMCHTLKNVAQLEKGSALRKLCHTFKDMRHTLKNMTHLQTYKNWVSLRKGACLGKRATLQNRIRRVRTENIA